MKLSLTFEKAYDRIDRTAMWDVLKMYGVGGEFNEWGEKFFIRIQRHVSR